MDGQVEQTPDTGVLGLAEFLTEPPETDSDEPQEEAADTHSDEEQAHESADAPEADEEESNEEDSEETPQEQEPRKYKVTVKGEDGADVEQEVEEAELIAGYQRQTDYTRKTQELAKRESETAQFLKSKHDEFIGEHLKQAEVAKAVVYQLAGVKTQQEMYDLAQNDPAAYVAEKERQEMIRGFIGQVDQYVGQINHRQQAEQQQQTEQVKQAAWEALSKENITREGLAKVYQDSRQKYGVQDATLANLYDPGLVLMMRDALAFRDLKNKVPEVTKRAKEAPRMPADKPQHTRSERQNADLDKKFKSGRAKLADLAAYLR